MDGQRRKKHQSIQLFIHLWRSVFTHLLDLKTSLQSAKSNNEQITNKARKLRKVSSETQFNADRLFACMSIWCIVQFTANECLHFIKSCMESANIALTVYNSRLSGFCHITREKIEFPWVMQLYKTKRHRMLFMCCIHVARKNQSRKLLMYVKVLPAII